MERYINGLWNYAGFSATAGCNFLGKTRKTVICTGQKEKPKKPPSLLTKTENQRLNSRNPANRGRPQSRKTATSESAKTEKQNQTLAKSAKPKIPTPPSFRFKRKTYLENRCSLSLPHILVAGSIPVIS